MLLKRKRKQIRISITIRIAKDHTYISQRCIFLNFIHHAIASQIGILILERTEFVLRSFLYKPIR